MSVNTAIKILFNRGGVMKASGGEREGVVAVKRLNRTPEACLYVRSSALIEPASRTLLFQQVISKAPEHDLASLDCQQGLFACTAQQPTFLLTSLVSSDICLHSLVLAFHWRV